MGYVPKGAQKKLNTVSLGAMGRVRANTAAILAIMGAQVTERVLTQAAGEIPRRLELGVTPQHVCFAYDVYFDGKKQTLCTVADVDKGYIKRYIRGVGHKAVANKNGKYDMELLFGKVEIIPKGAKHVGTKAGSAGQDEGSADPGSGDGAPARCHSEAVRRSFDDE